MVASNHERMSSVDTAWLRMDGPGNSMMIVSVTATATPLDPAEFRRMIEHRFLCFPRFRQRPVVDVAGASWVDDPGFDLDAHLQTLDLPQPAGKGELEAVTAELASTPLDPGRPLWQVHLVEHYKGGSAWIMRLHHCYADGIAIMRVLLSMTEQDCGPGLAGAQSAPGRKGRRGARGRKAASDLLSMLDWAGQLSQPAGDIIENALAQGARLLEGGIHRAFHPEKAALLAVQAGGMIGEFVRVVGMPDDPLTPLRGKLSGRKAVAWTDPIPLHEVKAVGKALGCTVNDVLMATVAGALGQHLRAVRLNTRGLALRASVPVNLRGAEEGLALGNKFGLVFVELPVGMRDPLQRAFAMHETMMALKGSLQPPMTLMVLGLMGMLPAAAQAPAIQLFSRKGSLVASNVPGPQAPLYLCGQRISEMYFWVPQSGSIGVGVSILSYAGEVFFGVIADRALVPDPQSVAARFAPEFERLLLATTVGALAARPREPAAPAKPRRTRKPRRPASRRRAPASGTT